MGEDREHRSGETGIRGPDGLTPVERVIARDEIRQLAYRYAHAVDTRDLDLLVSLFVPDVRVGRDAEGHEALRGFWLESLAAIGMSVLFVGNHLIDFDDPDHAHGYVYCRGYIAQPDRPGQEFIEQAIRYEDTYERREGRWLFVRRVHLLWYGVPTAEAPLDQEPARWPLNQIGTGSLPMADPAWDRFWSEAGRPPPG